MNTLLSVLLRFRATASLVKINDYPIDFKPEENILIIEHTDRPGIKPALLGEHQVNIASMRLARLSKEGDLWSYSLDNPPAEETHRKIEEHNEHP